MPKTINVIKETFISLAVIAAVVGSLYLFRLLPSSNTNDVKDTIKLPDIEEPVSVATTTTELLLSTGNLLKEPYIPNQNVYTSDYDKIAVKLALNGKFKEAKLLITGEIFDSNDHFISLNFDNISGVFKGVRSNIDRLDVNATKELGGVFTRGPFDFEVNLLTKTLLSTTKEEFLASGEKSKSITLWDNMILEPPTVVRLLVAPFNKNGLYGGGKITSIEFKYVCETEGECDAALCDPQQIYTECLKGNFNYSAAKDWCNRSLLEPCKDF